MDKEFNPVTVVVGIGIVGLLGFLVWREVSNQQPQGNPMQGKAKDKLNDLFGSNSGTRVGQAEPEPSGFDPRGKTPRLDVEALLR